MPEIELYNRDTNGDPAVAFATDAEIAIADQLRHHLEERYLATSAPSSPMQVRSSEGHPLDPPSTEYRVPYGGGTPALANFWRLETLPGSA